jgi:outer membrane translocation and assembly module TamA
LFRFVQDKLAAKEEMRRQAAARKMQQITRGKQLRAELEARKPELAAKKKALEEAHAYERKVVLIQTRIRMRQGLARGEEVKGAAALQRAVRMRAAKKELGSKQKQLFDEQLRKSRFGQGPDPRKAGAQDGAAGVSFSRSKGSTIGGSGSGGGGGSSSKDSADVGKKDTFSRVKSTLRGATSRGATSRKRTVQSASLPNLQGQRM